MVRPLSRLTIVRTSRLMAPIVVLALLGAFAINNRITDVWVAMLFGVIGYLMKKYQWSRVAFVMALVLGPLFEQNLLLTLNLQRLDRIDFWARPSVLVIVALIVLTTVPIWLRRKLVT
jgi:putative tricarboxylic transport membrane protein